MLLADEVDRYPGSAGTEGDPLSLAQKRQTTFWDKKTVMVSTPVIKGHSRIETEYNQSTREEWNVPCPECGHYQPFVWANLIFDPDDLQKEIVYKCERCGCVANEYRWKQQSQQGRFVAENPGAETRGFHLNTLASTFCGWKEIVQKFIVAKEQLDQGNPEGMKVWVNTELGETWEERGEQVEDTELFNRREIYDAVVPEEVLVLTAGVDVQDDRFEVEIVGWGVGKESWGIRYQKIYGDMLKEQVWEDLDAFLQTVWCKKDGTALRIISCCIDSGGHHTDQVYRFTKERYERGVWAIKGKGGAEVPYIRNPTTNNRVKTPLFIIGALNTIRENILNLYTKKTGREKDEVAAWMDATSWWTGEEAKTNGFVDELVDDGEKTVVENRGGLLFVNSVNMNLPFDKAPKFVQNSVAAAPAASGFVNTPTPAEQPGNNSHKEDTNMANEIKTVDELRGAYPALVDQIEQAAALRATNAERQRIRDIEEMALPGSEQITNEAKYDKPMSASDYAKAAMKNAKEQGAAWLNTMQQGANASGVNSVGSAPAPTGGEKPDEFMDAIKGLGKKQ